MFAALWLGLLAQAVAGLRVPFTADMVPSAVLPLVTVVVLARATRRIGRPANGWLHSEVWPS